MELSNAFDVAAPIDRAWRVLTDLERIAPCLPGAQLQEVEGDEYRGIIKVKVGPVTAQYKGKATFVERDEAAGRAVLSADGRDTRGQGNASATITAQLTPSDAGTHVVVDTDLKVTGKVAQFGRGVMADVSAKLMAQFVENLETTVLADEGADGAVGNAAGRDVASPVEAPAADDTAAAATLPDASEDEVTPAPEPAPDAPVVRTIDSPEAAPLDLMEVAGAKTMSKIALPVVVLVVILVVLLVFALR